MRLLTVNHGIKNSMHDKQFLGRVRSNMLFPQGWMHVIGQMIDDLAKTQYF